MLGVLCQVSGVACHVLPVTNTNSYIHKPSISEPQLQSLKPMSFNKFTNYFFCK